MFLFHFEGGCWQSDFSMQLLWIPDLILDATEDFVYFFFFINISYLQSVLSLQRGILSCVYIKVCLLRSMGYHLSSTFYLR